MWNPTKKHTASSNEKTYRVVDTDIDTVTTQTALHQFTSSQLLASLQARALDDPQAAIKASVERLVAHPAVRLLEPAARALGEDLGVTGKDEPAAMPFYTTAMKLTEAGSRSERKRMQELVRKLFLSSCCGTGISKLRLDYMSTMYGRRVLWAMWLWVHVLDHCLWRLLSAQGMRGARCLLPKKRLLLRKMPLPILLCLCWL